MRSDGIFGVCHRRGAALGTSGLGWAMSSMGLAARGGAGGAAPSSMQVPACRRRCFKPLPS